MSKYPRTYHLPWSPGATSDDKISNSIDTILGKKIVITEKLDGSNSSITNKGVYGRSHVDFTKNPWDIKLWDLFYRIKNDISDDVFLFGEGMYGIHSIEYKNLKSYYYLFGVRDNNIWISWDSVEEYSYILDIPLVPVLYTGVFNSEIEMKSKIDEILKSPSELGGEKEGIVIRSYDLFHNDDFSKNVFKWVRKNHVQTDSHWTKNWKKSSLN